MKNMPPEDEDDWDNCIETGWCQRKTVLENPQPVANPGARFAYVHLFKAACQFWATKLFHISTTSKPTSIQRPGH